MDRSEAPSRALFLAWLAAACGFGVLAASGQLIYIGAGLGLLAGVFLARNPQRLIPWLVVLSLVSGTLISLMGPGAAKFAWIVSGLAFVLWPLALLRAGRGARLPAFLKLTGLFVGVALLSTLIQGHGLAEMSAGFKRYFQGCGLLFALALLPLAPAQLRNLQRLLIGIALLQLPFAVYELLVLVPRRGGLEAGGETTDVVAGTFGANLVGGSPNAEMAIFLLVVFAFMLGRWRSGCIGARRFALLVLPCLAPLALGETKIVVLLLPLLLATMMRKDFLRAPLANLPALLGGLLLALGLAYVYIVVMDQSSVGYSLSDTLAYNAGTTGYGNNLLNRSSVLTFWWDRHGLDAPQQFLFGHGLGSAFLGVNNPAPGHVALRYPRYGIDLTTASTLLWDTGLVGLILHCAILVAAWVAANRLWRQTDAARVRADALAIQAAIAMFVVFVVYRDSGVNLLAYEVLTALVLGYLAHLLNQLPAARQAPPRGMPRPAANKAANKAESAATNAAANAASNGAAP